MAKKTYNVKVSRIFKGKRVTETIQVDALTSNAAQKRALWFYGKAASNSKTTPVKGGTKIAKIKKPSYLRI